MRRAKLGFVGDVMLGRAIDDLLRSHAPEDVLGDIHPLLRQADAVLGNLECAITDRKRVWSASPKAFHFRAGPHAVKLLTAGNVRYVSLANNHILDCEVEGLRDTLRHLDRAGIVHAGAGMSAAEATAPSIVQTGDLRIGILSATDNEPPFAAVDGNAGTNFFPRDDPSSILQWVESQVPRLRNEGVDVVVFSVHWGPNLLEVPPPPIQRLAHALIDLGVDIVHGHSAHVFQGVERHGRGLILYDCGEFIDDYETDPVLHSDWAFLFLVDVDEEGVGDLHMVPFDIRAGRLRLTDGPLFDSICQCMRRRSAMIGTPPRLIDEGLRLDAPGQRKPNVSGSTPLAAPSESATYDLAAGTELFLFEDEGVVFSEKTQAFHRLNSTAAVIWCLFEEFRDLDRVVSDFARLAGHSELDGRDQVTQLLERWHALGLLTAGEDAATLPEPSGPADPRPSQDDQLWHQMDAAYEARLRVLDRHIRLRCASRQQTRWIRPAIEGILAEGTGSNDAQIDVIEKNGIHEVFVDNQSTIRCREPRYLGPAVWSACRDVAMATSEDIFWIKGGAVSLGGMVIVLPSAEQKLASALVALLTIDGAAPLSGDCIALDRNSLAARGVPLPCQISPRDWPAFRDRLDTRAPRRIHFRRDGEKVRYVTLGEISTRPQIFGPQAVDVLVALKRSGDAETLIQPIKLIEALSRLLAESMACPADFTRRDVGRMMQWLGGTECFELSIGSLDDAVTRISKLVEA